MMKDVPPAYFLLGIVVATVPHFLLTQFNLIPFPFNWLGSVLVIGGVVLNGLATKEFEKHHTPHDFSTSTALVTSGVYKFSRNPIYLGMVLILVGVAILFRNPFGFLAPILFFFIIEFKFIPFEEEKMVAEIGVSYNEYQQRVRRWI
jgi:protein-S-isoprenylcysteine O-methyltransferase Ste14